jgi:Zn-dependent protease
MLDLAFKNPLLFLVFGLFLISSVAVHEFAHALAADRLGDPTPRAKGRLSLNPLVHLDPIGTLFILFWGFGWGKPVPYDPYNLQDPDRDGAKIALAGPLSSLLLAVVGAILFRLFPESLISSLASYLVVLNVYLAVFNLVPIHPLDGFQVVAGILPESQREEWYALRRYGLVLLLFMLFPLVNGQSLLFTVIQPIVSLILGILVPTGSIL